MRIKTHIGLIFKADVGAVAYNNILARCPEADKGKYFKGVFEECDERLNDVIQHLNNAGFRPNLTHSRSKPGEFKMWRERVYEPRDFENVSLLEPSPSNSFETITKRTSEGLLALSPDAGKRAEIARVDPSMLAVSKSLKTLMETAGLQHLVFCPPEYLATMRTNLNPMRIGN